MKIYPTVSRSLGLALALTTIAIMPLAAQKQTARQAPLNEKLTEQMKTQAGELTANYWTPKLNAYKVRIDRALSPSDLDELNRLRVRFSILMGEKMQMMGERKASGANGNRMQMKVDDDEAMKKANEFMDIYSSTKELAGRYPDDLKLLGENVIGDVISFADMVAQKSGEFVSTHRSEMTPEQVSEFTDKVRAFNETVSELKADNDGRMGLAAIYSFAVEPIIMLYNGADLGELLQQVGAVSKPVAGIELPESGVLKQNFPNPARTKTTIAYTLAEQSSTTVLRLFDANGATIKTVELGAQSAGEQTVGLDVSGLATGTYLYQLSIQTSKGEQVFSKRMQVMR